MPVKKFSEFHRTVIEKDEHKTVAKVAKKNGVKEKEIMKYFDKEMLTI